MQSSNSSQNKSDSNNQLANTPLLICLDCEKKIPKLELEFSDSQMDIKMSCSCSNKTSRLSLSDFFQGIGKIKPKALACNLHNQKGEMYCPKCIKWLCKECILSHQEFAANEHLLIEHELEVQCNTHKKSFDRYCLRCQVNLCKECPLHPNHKVIAIQPSAIECKENLFDRAIAQNSEQTNKLAKRLDDTIEELTQMREDILFSNYLNKSINQELKQLHQSFCRTSLVFSSQLCYELSRLKEDFIFNADECPKEESNLYSAFSELNKYLKTTHVMSQKKTCDAILKGHCQEVSCLVELKDGRLASGSLDMTILLWKIISKENEAILIGHSAGVCCLVEMKDGRLAWLRMIKPFDYGILPLINAYPF